MGDEAAGRTAPVLAGLAVRQALAERLLLWTIPDLDHRARKDADHYEALGLAAILRRTLVDKNSVVHAARNRLAIPLPQFHFTPVDVPSLPSVVPGGRWVPVLGFAGPAFAEPTQQATLKQFLAAPAGTYRGEPVSVSRVIRYFANVGGGVHLGSPEDGFEELVQQLVASIESAGGTWVNALKQIAAVTVRALEPMAETIRANPIYPGHA